MLKARTGAGTEPTRPGFESGSAAAIWTDNSGEMVGAGARDGLVSSPESEVREKNVAGGTCNGSRNNSDLIESVKIKLQRAHGGEGVGGVLLPPTMIEPDIPIGAFPQRRTNTFSFFFFFFKFCLLSVCYCARLHQRVRAD